jgi:hypothetical protein
MPDSTVDDVNSVGVRPSLEMGHKCRSAAAMRDFAAKMRGAATGELRPLGLSALQQSVVDRPPLAVEVVPR